MDGRHRRSASWRQGLLDGKFYCGDGRTWVTYNDETFTIANARFTAAARAVVPDLLDRVAALEAENAKFREAVCRRDEEVLLLVGQRTDLEVENARLLRRAEEAQEESRVLTAMGALLRTRAEAAEAENARLQTDLKFGAQRGTEKQ